MYTFVYNNNLATIERRNTQVIIKIHRAHFPKRKLN